MTNLLGFYESIIGDADTGVALGATFIGADVLSRPSERFPSLDRPDFAEWLGFEMISPVSKGDVEPALATVIAARNAVDARDLWATRGALLPPEPLRTGLAEAFADSDLVIVENSPHQAVD